MTSTARNLALLVSLAAPVLVGCQRDRARDGSDPGRPDDAPRMVAAGPGEVSELVRAAIDDATPKQEIVVVYIGAEWCGPCHVFKDALKAGSLDDDLAGVRFLEFDFDRDEDRLSAAGYDGEWLPRFVIPAPDGRGTSKRIEGSIKGPKAAAEITPRLRSLLGR